MGPPGGGGGGDPKGLYILFKIHLLNTLFKKKKNCHHLHRHDSFQEGPLWMTTWSGRKFVLKCPYGDRPHWGTRDSTVVSCPLRGGMPGQPVPEGPWCVTGRPPRHPGSPARGAAPTPRATPAAPLAQEQSPGAQAGCLGGDRAGRLRAEAPGGGLRTVATCPGPCPARRRLGGHRREVGRVVTLCWGLVLPGGQGRPPSYARDAPRSAPAFGGPWG